VITLRKRLRSIWFVTVLIFVLAFSMGSSVTSGCDEDTLAGATVSLTQQPHACAEPQGGQPCRSATDHQGHACCVCSCHIVGAFTSGQVLTASVPLGLLPSDGPKHLDDVDLPGILHPPI